MYFPYFSQIALYLGNSVNLTVQDQIIPDTAIHGAEGPSVDRRPGFEPVARRAVGIYEPRKVVVSRCSGWHPMRPDCGYRSTTSGGGGNRTRVSPGPNGGFSGSTRPASGLTIRPLSYYFLRGNPFGRGCSTSWTATITISSRAT